VARDAVGTLLARLAARRTALETDAGCARAGRTGAIGVHLARSVANLSVLRMRAHLCSTRGGGAEFAVGVQAVGVHAAWFAASCTALTSNAHVAYAALGAVNIRGALSTAWHVACRTLADDAVSAGGVQALG